MPFNGLFAFDGLSTIKVPSPTYSPPFFFQDEFPILKGLKGPLPAPSRKVILTFSSRRAAVLGISFPVREIAHLLSSIWALSRPVSTKV